jgi:hypothetical protein
MSTATTAPRPKRALPPLMRLTEAAIGNCLCACCSFSYVLLVELGGGGGGPAVRR